MKVRIKFIGMPELPSVFNGKEEGQLDLKEDTLKDLLNHLLSKMKLKEKHMLLNEQKEISPELLVFLNGRPLYDANRLNQQLGEGDLIELGVFSG